MKAICNTQAMKEAFALAARCVPRNSPMEVLKTVEMTSTEDGTTTLRATDLDVSIVRRLSGVTAETPGRVLLSAERFGHLLRTISATTDPEIVIQSTETTASVTTSASKIDMEVLPADTFPGTMDTAETCEMTLDGGALSAALNRVAFAIDEDSVRYALGGINFDYADGTLKLVTTDGRRLAMHPLRPMSGDNAGPIAGVVPPKAFRLLQSVLGKNDVVRFTMDNRSATFETELATIRTRLVEGRFPRYQDVIPPTKGQGILITGDTLDAAVSMASVACDATSSGVRFEFQNNGAKLTAKGSVSRSNVFMPYSDDVWTFSSLTLDWRYVAELAKVMGGETMEMRPGHDGKVPVRFDHDSGYIHVIMPLTME